MSVLCIAILGLINAIKWAVIFPLAIDELEEFTKTESNSFQKEDLCKIHQFYKPTYLCNNLL